MIRDDPTIIIMAKAPRAGMVKTRLGALLTDRQCGEIAECFLRDTIARTANITANITIAFSPTDGQAEILACTPGQYRCVEQQGSDLGERLTAVVADVYAHRPGPVIVLGTDSPTLPAKYIDAAINHLSHNGNPVVIGPTDDGGYYLIGMQRPEPAIFEDIGWSSERVYEQTIARIRAVSDVDLLELPRWYDVDTPQDLCRLFNEIKGDTESRTAAPETLRWLKSNKKLFDAPAHIF